VNSRIPAASVAVLLLLVCCRLGHSADLESLVAGPVRKVVGDCKFTEGPAWHPEGYLLFSDIPNSRILRVNVDGTASDWLNPSGGANGLMCDQHGNVYACQGADRCLSLLKTDENGAGKLVRILAKEFEGQPFNQPNDLAIDGSGGLYFTDPNYRGADQPPTQPVQGVYYVSAAGAVSRVIDDLPRPNGILVTADGKTLYVANIELRQILKYPIEGPGQLGPADVLFTGDEQLDGNGPDGMTLDEHGNIYATYRQLVVVSSAGELIGRVDVGEKPANCAFGGDDNKTLYVTAQTSLYALPMQVHGIALAQAGPGAEPGSAQTFEARDLKLQIPARWEQQEPSNRLRLAQFAIPPADGDPEAAELVVSGPFGGTDQANIERWLGQFDSQGRTVKMTQGTGAAGEYVVVELTGTYNKPVGPAVQGRTEPAPGFKMLGVIVKLEPGGNYFLKLTGPEKTVDAAADELRGTIGGKADQETEFSLPES
jgi:gluconolactonase